MTHEPDNHDPLSVPKPSTRTTLLHWCIFLGLMTALIGGAALVF